MPARSYPRLALRLAGASIGVLLLAVLLLTLLYKTAPGQALLLAVPESLLEGLYALFAPAGVEDQTNAEVLFFFVVSVLVSAALLLVVRGLTRRARSRSEEGRAAKRV